MVGGGRWGRPAAVAVALAAAILTGCGFAQRSQTTQVDGNFAAVPADVVRALQLGPLLHDYSSEGGGDDRALAARVIGVKAGTPPPVALGDWVAVCRMVAEALRSATGKAYGRLPGDSRTYLATGPLCDRGLGHQYPAGSPSLSFDLAEGIPPELFIGVPQEDGRILDTAVNVELNSVVVNASGPQLVSQAFNWRERGGEVTVAPFDAAAYDRTVIAGATSRLPWSFGLGQPFAVPPVPVPPESSPESVAPSASDDNRQVAYMRVFVIPARQRLRLTVACERIGFFAQISYQEELAELRFWVGDHELDSTAGAAARPCPATIATPLRPQLTYTDGTGRPVSLYAFRVEGTFDSQVAYRPPARVEALA